MTYRVTGPLTLDWPIVLGDGDHGASPALPSLTTKRIRTRPANDSLAPKFDAAGSE